MNVEVVQVLTKLDALITVVAVDEHVAAVRVRNLPDESRRAVGISWWWFIYRRLKFNELIKMKIFG